MKSGCSARSVSVRPTEYKLAGNVTGCGHIDQRTSTLATCFTSALAAQEPRVLLHDDQVRHLAFLPDDKQVLGACTKFVCVWDIDSGHEVRRFPKLNSIMCAATSSDGLTVAVAEGRLGVLGNGWVGH